MPRYVEDAVPTGLWTYIFAADPALPRWANYFRRL